MNFLLRVDELEAVGNVVEYRHLHFQHRSKIAEMTDIEA
jgi:hypothetical protein